MLDTRVTQTNWETSLKPSFLFFFQKKDFSFRALLRSDTQNIKGAQSIAWYVRRVYILIWVVAHIFQTTLSVPNCEYQNSDVIPIFASKHWALYYKRVYWYSDNINSKSISIALNLNILKIDNDTGYIKVILLNQRVLVIPWIFVQENDDIWFWTI